MRTRTTVTSSCPTTSFCPLLMSLRMAPAVLQPQSAGEAPMPCAPSCAFSTAWSGLIAVFKWVTLCLLMVHCGFCWYSPIASLGCALVQEVLSLVGVLPAVVKFAGPEHVPALRLQAARFVGQLCASSDITLQMFVACGGLDVRWCSQSSTVCLSCC